MTVLGLLTRIFWIGNLQELEEGFELVKDSVVLRTLTDDDKQEYSELNPPHQIEPSQKHDYYVVVEIIEREVDWYQLLIDILLALQLYKNDTVFYEGYYLMGPYQVPRIKPVITPPSFHYSYRLSSEDIPVIRELLEKIKEVDFEKNISLRIACDRYSRMHADSYVPDRIIDACIAYEALFLRGEYRGSDKGTVVGLACSHLLGSNNEDRESIKQIIQEGFHLRNVIIHGKDPSTDEVIRINTPFGDYLRQSILKLL